MMIKLYYSVNQKWLNKLITFSKNEDLYIEVCKQSGIQVNSDIKPALASMSGKIDEYYPVNPSKDWHNIETNINDFFKIVAEMGFPICTQLTDGYRRDASFTKTNLFLVDIDDGLKIEEAKEHPFYKEYSSGFYTSPSHTNENHRFRIVFITEKLITDPEDARALRIGLASIFNGDKATISAAQMFYGCRNAKKEIRRHEEEDEITDIILPEKIYSKLIEVNKKIIEEKKNNIINLSDYHEPSSKKLNAIKTEIINCGRVGYDEWIRIIWAMRKIGFNYNDAHDATTFIKPAHLHELKRLWDDYDSSRTPGWGIIGNAIGGWSDFYKKYPEFKSDIKKEVANESKKNINNNIKPFFNFIEDKKKREELENSIEITTDRYLKDIGVFDKNNNIVSGIHFIKSPTDTGKTETIKREVSEKVKKQGLKFLNITHRQKLSDNIADRLCIKSYRDNGVYINEEGLLTICVNSLRKLDMMVHTINPYDVIVIDESEQFLQYIVQTGGKNNAGVIKPHERPEIFKILQQLIRKAKAVVCLDADISDLSIEYMSRLKYAHESDYKLHLLVNTYKPREKEIHIYDNIGGILSEIETTIRDGKSTFIACNTVKQAETLYKRIKHIKENNVFLITATTKDGAAESNVLSFITKNNGNFVPSKVAKAIDWADGNNGLRVNDLVIISTPTLGTGYDVLYPFEMVFGVFTSNQTTNFHDAAQHLARVRKNDTWHVYLPDVEVDMDIEKTILNITERQKYIMKEREKWLINSGGIFESIVDPSLKAWAEDLYAHTMAINAVGRYYIKKLFIHSMKDKGYSVKKKSVDGTNLDGIDDEDDTNFVERLFSVESYILGQLGIVAATKKPLSGTLEYFRYKVESTFMGRIEAFLEGGYVENDYWELFKEMVDDYKLIKNAYVLQKMQLSVSELMELDRKEKDWFSFDKRYNLTKVQLLNEILQVLGLYNIKHVLDIIGKDENISFTKNDAAIKDLVDWKKKNENVVKTYFDATGNDGMKLLTLFFKEMGLKMTTKKTSKMVNGKKKDTRIKQLDIDFCKKVLGIIEETHIKDFGKTDKTSIDHVVESRKIDMTDDILQLAGSILG